MERIKIGTFEVTNKEIIAIDPCYKNRMMGTINKAKNGTYNVYAYVGKINDWGKRVVAMEAIHADDDYEAETLFWEYSSDSPVDSGTFSFMDSEYYDYTRPGGFLDEMWYDKNVVGMLEQYHIVDNRASICSAGFGDGLYEISVVYDDDNEMCETICAVRVTFIDVTDCDEE